MAGPFPGFPEGLGFQASARGVADLAKAPGLGGGPRLAITGLEAQRGYVKVFHSLYCPGCHNLPRLWRAFRTAQALLPISMQIPYELALGWRYTRAGRATRRNGFISFISGVSMLGIALGVAALIIVLSVMNGFQKDVRDRMLSVVSHIEIFAPWGPHCRTRRSPWPRPRKTRM